MPENIISRYCHHWAPLLRAREREREKNRGGEKKKRALVLFYVLSIEEMTLFMVITNPFHPSPLNGMIRRANRFGQVGAFMNKT